MRVIKLLQRYPAWSIICLLAPFLFIGAIVILPTHDDWFSLVSPSQEPFFTKERFLFYGYHWRPFDSIFGYIVGLNHRLLFPTLNHICVITGHICCTWLVYSISGLLSFNKTARNIATIFYFIAPATLATIFAVDGLNQTYSNLWGMAALYLYLRGVKGVKGVKGVTINTQHPTSITYHLLFILFVIISTLCKENGISWAFITPIMACGFNIIDRKILIRDLILGVLIVIIYAAAIVLLPSNIIIEAEYVPSIGKIATNIIKFIFTSWITIDYVYILHQPSVNIIMALITFILTLPFFYVILRRQGVKGVTINTQHPTPNIHHLKIHHLKIILTLFICQIIAVGPHLGTVFSMMHTYAGHCFTAFIIAYLINRGKEKEVRGKAPLSMGEGLVWKAFALYILSALFINIHIWYTSYESGIMGRDMCMQIIEKTNGTPKRVRCINIADNYPKLSSFRVIPFEAIGWGYAVKYYTDYKWPDSLVSEEISNLPTSLDEAKILARDYLKNNICDCVWIINHKDITVINK